MLIRGRLCDLYQTDRYSDCVFGVVYIFEWTLKSLFSFTNKLIWYLLWNFKNWYSGCRPTLIFAVLLEEFWTSSDKTASVIDCLVPDETLGSIFEKKKKKALPARSGERFYKPVVAVWSEVSSSWWIRDDKNLRCIPSEVWAAEAFRAVAQTWTTVSIRYSKFKFLICSLSYKYTKMHS